MSHNYSIYTESLVCSSVCCKISFTFTLTTHFLGFYV